MLYEQTIGKTLIHHSAVITLLLRATYRFCEFGKQKFIRTATVTAFAFARTSLHFVHSYSLQVTSITNKHRKKGALAYYLYCIKAHSKNKTALRKHLQPMETA
jgi:hypothetical protein